MPNVRLLELALCGRILASMESEAATPTGGTAGDMRARAAELRKRLAEMVPRAAPLACRRRALRALRACAVAAGDSSVATQALSADLGRPVLEGTAEIAMVVAECDNALLMLSRWAANENATTPLLTWMAGAYKSEVRARAAWFLQEGKVWRLRSGCHASGIASLRRQHTDRTPCYGR